MDGSSGHPAVHVGRRDELGRALSAVGDGVGVVVVGAPGSGRSHFVREVLSRLDDAQRSRLWVGHDLERLDEQAAGRWARAVGDGEIVPLATALTGRMPRAIRSLRGRGALLLLELGALSARELLVLAEAHLAGRLDPASVPAFIPSRGGRQLGTLVDALSSARSEGALNRSEAGWTLSTPVVTDAGLRARIFERPGEDVRRDSPDAATILDVLGLAPGLGLRKSVMVLERAGLAGAGIEAQLERLEESELIVIDDSTGPGGPFLRIQDGIDESAIVLTIGILRRRRLTTAIVDVLADGAPTALSADEVLALARHSLDLGRSPGQDLLVRAARISLRTPDAAQSLRLAEAATEAGAGFDAAMTLAAARSQAGDAEQALALLARTADEAADDVQRSAALQAMTRHVRESAPHVVEVIDDDSLDRLALSDTRRDLLRGFLLFNLGEVVAAADLITPGLPESTGLERAEAHFLVGTAHLFLGHLQRAAEALDEAEAAYAAVGADASNVHMVRANLNATRGRIDESLPVVRAVRDLMTTFGQPVAQGMCGWAIGTLLLSAGRVGEAVEEFRDTAGILERAGVGRTLALVRLDLALALALSGKSEAAREALPWTSPDGYGAGAGVTGKSYQVEGWILVGEGQLDEARDRFIRSADTHEAGGFLLPCLAVLVEAARVGGAGELLTRIERVAAGMDGSYVVVVVRLARALAGLEAVDAPGPSQDADRVGRLAAEFDDLGSAAEALDLHIVAAEAYDHAARLHRRRGSDRHAAASARRRDARIAACGLDRLLLLRDIHPAELSARERELAQLAAAGYSNREIAERLVLSVRTVETHLQRVYRKMGIRGRSELAETLNPR